jgi:hypothetical protein
MANPEMRSPHQPPDNPPADNSPPDNPPPDNPPNQRPEPNEIYAPKAERPPETGSSVLMWAWVLFTALLAGLVAWGWIQYLHEPDAPPATNSAADG